MRKLKKQLLRAMIACGLVVSVAAGGTMAYLTDAETATNTFTVGKVKIDLEEPGYPGNDSDEVKNIIPNQEIVKNPQIENTGNNDALVFLRVEVPQETFTELDADNNVGEKKLQDLFKLKNVSDQWELLRTETTTEADGKVKTSYVYGYKKTLAKGSTTDKLFEKVQMKNSIEKDLEGNVEDVIVIACAIQATDILDVELTPGSDGTIDKDVLNRVYEIFMKQSGNRSNKPGNDNPQQEETATLISGKEINTKMKKLAGAGDGDNTIDETIIAIQHSDSAPSDSVMASADSIISTEDSEKPIYIWFERTQKGDDEGIIKWWSEAKNVKTGSDLSYLCTDMNNLSDISGLKSWDTTDLTNMSCMFASLKQNQATNFSKAISDITPIADWDVSHVNNMSYLFDHCRSLNDITPLTNWNVQNVTNMEYMFQLCGFSDLTPIADWNISNVSNASGMFDACGNLEKLDPIADWDISNITDMSSMFVSCTSLKSISALANWNVGHVMDMSGMFYCCTSLKDISTLANWNVENVTDMHRMFFMCRSLSDASAINDWNIQNVTNFQEMFFLSSHPKFTKRSGTWDSRGTFKPTT